MAFTAESPHGNSSNGCCLCITMDQLYLCMCVFVDVPTKQKDEKMAKDLDDAMKNVMEGVKNQAGRIRETVDRLEWERDAAVAARDAAQAEIKVCYHALLYTINRVHCSGPAHPSMIASGENCLLHFERPLAPVIQAMVVAHGCLR